MRDAFGGIVNIVIIVVFLVIVSGYMAYTVNYTKAFRVKNKIISTFEQYEDACATGGSPSSNSCNKVIADYMKQVGYSQVSQTMPDGWTCPQGMGYCFRRYESAATIDQPQKVYYKITTWVNMDIPLINRIMPTLFQVQGDTKALDISN